MHVARNDVSQWEVEYMEVRKWFGIQLFSQTAS